MAIAGKSSEPKPRPVASPSHWCLDGHRAGVSLVVSIVVPVVVGMILRSAAPSIGSGLATTVALSLLGWNIFVAVYVVLTALTFSKRSSEEFRARIIARSAGRSKLSAKLNPAGDGPTFAIEAALVAFAVVLVLPNINAIRIDDWLLVPLTLTILTSCWCLAVYSYALHYAQHDLEESGFDFPGKRTKAFADYLYFSLAVATTLGATDVNVTTPAMRRIVNLHVVLTFLYNTVIVALLVSLLLR